MATSTVCAVSVAAPLADVSRLSSGNAFRGSTSSVQVAPVTSKKANRAFAVRAGLSEQLQKCARREILASILATGAAFTVAGGALAGPIPGGKTLNQTVAGAQNVAPGGGNAGKALKDVKKQAGGLVGNNPFQSGKDKVASFADRAGSSIGKASDNVKNLKPVGNTLARPEKSSFEEKTSQALKKAGSIKTDLQKQGEKAVGKAQKSVKGKVPEIPKPDIGKLFGDGPKKAGSIGSDVQKQGGSAVGQAKNSVKGNAPEIPKPDIGSFFGDATKKAGSFGSDIQKQGSSAVGQAKDSAKGNAPNLPKKPEIGSFFGSFQGFSRSVKSKGEEVAK